CSAVFAGIKTYDQSKEPICNHDPKDPIVRYILRAFIAYELYLKLSDGIPDDLNEREA
ncbi:hypothetical protein BX616_009589, partial [Lobosporangium transversale]